MAHALVTLAVVTVLVALVSEIFVESVQKAAETFGMSQAFVGFIVVALVGGTAEMAVAFSAARKDRLDLSVGIALGSASQIALFVGPVRHFLVFRDRRRYKRAIPAASPAPLEADAEFALHYKA